MAYSCVGPYQSGTCYRADGWKWCAADFGLTAGHRAVAPKAV